MVVAAVTSVAAVTLVAAAVAALVSAEYLILGAAALVGRVQTLVEWATAEADSACLVLRVESGTLRVGPRAFVRLSRHDHLCCRARADIRLVA